VFLLALACTYLFFIEYLPPVRLVHISYDLEGYHFPLANYAFQQLKQGHWPQWDPSIYSGMSFAANVQSAFYYPGTWLMYLATWGREQLSYQSLADLNLLHVPLAFTLCFVWLRQKGLRDMASVLGALVYAYSGYMCEQLQHFGLVVAYAWLPLAWLGVDQAEREGSWKPLWKVAVASALAFLGGYPPTWLVVAVVVGVYTVVSPGRWPTVAGVFGALVFSLALCGVQLLPTWDATHFREPELRYGIGVKDPMFYLSYLVPNYFDFAIDVPPDRNFGKQYMYLGAPGILGVLLALWSRRWRAILPGLAVVAVSLIIAINPYAIVWDSIKFSSLLSDIVRSGYFLAGVTPGCALLAAIGLDVFLERQSSVPGWLPKIAVGAMAVWGVSEIIRFAGPGFAAGPASLLDPLVTSIVFGVGLLVYRAQPKRWIGYALLLFVIVDYKVFGTSKRFDASPGQGVIYSSTEFGAMNQAAYRETRSYPDNRIVLHEFGPITSALRHVGWTSPQGFDPFLSTAFRELGKREGTWTSDRDLTLDPMRLDVMDRFGVRFVMTAERGGKYAELVAHPRYRMVGANDSYYKVFEYLDAKSIYQFAGTVNVERRDAGHRVLRVSSDAGGLLMFAEQGYPGWSAKVDGNEIPIETWNIAFQSVRVPAGTHTVEFVYQERMLTAGAGVSLIALGLLAWWIRASSRSICSTANLAVSG